MIAKFASLVLAVFIWEGCKHALKSDLLVAEKTSPQEYKVFSVEGPDRMYAGGGPNPEEEAENLENKLNDIRKENKDFSLHSCLIYKENEICIFKK